MRGRVFRRAIKRAPSLAASGVKGGAEIARHIRPAPARKALLGWARNLLALVMLTNGVYADQPAKHGRIIIARENRPFQTIGKEFGGGFHHQRYLHTTGGQIGRKLGRHRLAHLAGCRPHGDAEGRVGFDVVAPAVVVLVHIAHFVEQGIGGRGVKSGGGWQASGQRMGGGHVAIGEGGQPIGSVSQHGGAVGALQQGGADAAILEPIGAQGGGAAVAVNPQSDVFPNDPIGDV